MVQCFPYCTKTVETGMLTILQFGHGSFCGIWHEKSIKPQNLKNRLFQNTELNVLIVDVWSPNQNFFNKVQKMG